MCQARWDRPLSLLVQRDRPGRQRLAEADTARALLDDGTRPKLALDGEVECCEVLLTVGPLQSDTDVGLN